MITLNPPYWQYVGPCIQSLKKFFLNGHDVDFLLWSDMPETVEGARLFPTEGHQWPTPTLFRYGLFLREEELLKDYDFLFYCDSDMLAVSRIGDEVLGEGLTAAQHPMYALRREYLHPYEPNPASTAYMPSVGRTMDDKGKKRFEPLYAAGGFQGGRAQDFIKAMEVMKENIDQDFIKGYTAIWNDESHWNKYLLDNPPSVVLSPSYIYPDSLIKNYYTKLWGRNYVPRLVTLTKPFSLTKEGGVALQQILR